MIFIKNRLNHYYYIFFIIIVITQTSKSKNITVTRYYFIFPVTGKTEKNKLNQSEVEVKRIIKTKKHNLCSNWQVIFKSDTDKQTVIDLYGILIVKNLKEVHQIV